MEAYLILIVGLGALSIFPQKKWSFLLAFLGLFFIGGLRDVSVGTDSRNYQLLFQYYGDDVGSLSHANEPLYMLIQLVSSVGGWGYEGMQLISMTIMLTGLFWVSYKWSYNPIYTLLAYVLLYFFFYSFNIMRQYLAIPFVLLSYYYLAKSRWKKYLLCLSVAVMFHFTALISIVVWPLSKIRYKKEPLILMLLLTFVIGLTPLSQWVTQFFAQYITHFSDYANNEHEYRESLFSISRFLLNVYSILLLTWLKEKDNMLLILVLGVCILNLLSFQPVIGRLAQYFTIVQILIIPGINTMLRINSMKKVVTLGSFLYMCVTWIYLISSNAGEVVPWKMSEII